ncbi:hypothetical protein AB9C23_14605, partial [Citrobacter freundii]
VEEELQQETLSIVGWRDVPTNEGVLGEIALSSLPRIEMTGILCWFLEFRRLKDTVFTLRV